MGDCTTHGLAISVRTSCSLKECHGICMGFQSNMNMADTVRSLAAAISDRLLELSRLCLSGSGHPTQSHPGGGFNHFFAAPCRSMLKAINCKCQTLAGGPLRCHKTICQNLRLPLAVTGHIVHINSCLRTLHSSQTTT